MKTILSLIILLSLGCATSRVQLNAKWNPSEKPSYVDYMDYYWFGFSGRPTVNLQKICMDQKPYAIVNQRTVEDGVIFLFTLGIYAPSTVKVWCGD